MSATEAERLAGIRRALAEIAPGRWSRAADAEGEFLEAQGKRGELVEVCRFHAGASLAEIRFVTDAPEMVGFLLALVDRAARRVRELARETSREAPASGLPAVASHGSRPSSGPPQGGGERSSTGRDHAAEAAMIVQRAAFKAYLHEKHGLERPLTDERCTARLRHVLAIESRRELNADAAAAARWRALRADFKAWRGL